ncbi:MAG TPA: thioredoxin fold domain-containing protein [Burkholderiales bacterium]|nr:thioredoxin fold domain-containing protein [Burkholderiales bacterium]HUK04911.1 thioredoxin fold domain-containing protein [Burkholderiales bacterium]
MKALLLAAILGATPALAQDPRGALFAALEKTDAVVEGAKEPKRVLHVFWDANCYYCNLTWRALQRYERAGLQVRWVPVAYQKENSAALAAAVMGAKDRVAALRENETRYRARSYDGGIKAAAQVPADLAIELEENMTLMGRFGMSGTPALVWKDSGGQVQTHLGMPRLSRLPAITGLPEQKIDDPELAKYR